MVIASYSIIITRGAVRSNSQKPVSFEILMKLLSHLPSLLKRTYQEWKEDRASRLSAALAYYTIFSLAPLLVIVIAITGLIWNQDVVRTQLMNQIQSLVG